MGLSNPMENMSKGKPARLFPVLPDSRKEERATSILLAVFRAVPDFAKEVLAASGAPIGKRSELESYTEVSFKGERNSLRPDGLLSVSTRTGSWTALVESKVGRSELGVEQVEQYLDLAKERGIDAVITLSNQFTAVPSHHPLKVSKLKTRTVGLFHFSWLSILSTAIRLIENKLVTDREQAILLGELIRFLEDPASGVSASVRMSPDWREICELIHQNSPVKKNDSRAEAAVSDWFQLSRYLAIQLSVALGQPCSVWLPRKHISDPSERLREGVERLVSSSELTVDIEVPNAAGRISLTVSLLRKTLDLSVTVDTPRDVKQQRAAINFVLNQFRKHTPENVIARFNWPRRVPSTELPLSAAIDEENRKNLIPASTKELPASATLTRVIDLGGKLKTATGLPEVAEASLESFYKELMEGFRKWVASPPKFKHRVQEDESLETKANVESEPPPAYLPALPIYLGDFR